MAWTDVLSILVFQGFTSALRGAFICAGAKTVADKILDERTSGAVKFALMIAVGLVVFNVGASAVHAGIKIQGWGE